MRRYPELIESASHEMEYDSPKFCFPTQNLRSERRDALSSGLNLKQVREKYNIAKFIDVSPSRSETLVSYMKL